jgi:hypothetical protein
LPQQKNDNTIPWQEFYNVLLISCGHFFADVNMDLLDRECQRFQNSSAHGAVLELSAVLLPMLIEGLHSVITLDSKLRDRFPIPE